MYRHHYLSYQIFIIILLNRSNNSFSRKDETKSIIMNMLIDIEMGVVETIRMRLSTEQALQYLQDHGFNMSRATYFRYKRKVEEKKFERLYKISKIGFQDQHLERIEGIELALKEMWARYIDEKDNFRKVMILEKIIITIFTFK